MRVRSLLPLLLMLGCSTDSAPRSDLGVTGGDLAGRDLTPYNPRNPGGAGPATVEVGVSTDLTRAGAYAILAKTGVTNVTGSTITGGHVGVSPAAATFITGFSLTADSSTTFSTSPSVVPPGRVYAASYTAPTPSNLTSAILAMQGAYTDAAGRSPPDHLDLSSGNLGGLTLAPGLYTWGSSVTIPRNVTLAGGAADVWIFQISKDLDLSAATSVVLTGDAQPKNVIWQVAGNVTLHANSHFEGILLCQTGVTLQTKASLRGRILAQTLVALDDNAVTAP